MHEQPLFRLLPHPLYLPEGRRQGRLAAQRAVECDAEAVGLITYPLEQLQSLGVPVQEQRIWIAHAYHLFQPLGKSYDGQFLLQSELAQLSWRNSARP